MKLRIKENRIEKKNEHLETTITDKRTGNLVVFYKSKSLAGIFEELRIYELYNRNVEWPELKDMDTFDKLTFSNHINENYLIQQTSKITKQFMAGGL